MADIGFATAYLATVFFCASGAAVLPGDDCSDGSPKTTLTFSIVTAENCTSNFTEPADERACEKHVKNILEVRRNDELIAVVPADILTEREREAAFQLFMNPGTIK